MESARKISNAMLGAALAVLAAATSSAAQAPTGFDEAEHAARGLQINSIPPFGGLSEIGALSRAWSVNTFYVVYQGSYPNQRFFWAIRREASDGKSPSIVRWADSRSCPAVEKTLLAMEDLPLVRPDAIRLGRETNTLGLPFDGIHHVFWNRYARTGRNDATVNLELQGNTNSPMALWWADAVPQLAKCWSETQPKP